MKRTILSLTLLVLALPAVPVAADIVWNYSSDDGANMSMTGQLTTTGNQTDLLSNNTFALISIDSVTIQTAPGVFDDLDAGSDYQGGVAPPTGFGLNAEGKIVWNAGTMVGSDDPFTGSPPFPTNISVLSNDGTDVIQIGNSTLPGGGGTLAGFQSAYFFNAANNTYTPVTTAVPEPSSLAMLGISAIGMAVGGRRRRRKESRV